MTVYCIAWKLTKAREGKVYTGPPLRHPEYIFNYDRTLRKAGKLGIRQPNKEPGTPLTKEEVEAKAQRMNLAKEFPSHHWAIEYKGEEWKKINEKCTPTVSKER